MLQKIMLLAWIKEVVGLKKKNNNFNREIVKYRFAEKLNYSSR